MLFEVLVEVSFLTGDRLDLDDLVNPLILGDLGDDAVGLLAVPGPVDVNAIRSQVLLRLNEIMVEVAADAILDGLGSIAQILPIRGFGDTHGALIANRHGGITHVLALHRQVQLTLDGLRKLRHAHVRAGLVGGWGQPGDAVVSVRDATQFGAHGSVLLSVGEDFGDVNRLNARVLARQHTTDIHEAGVVAGDDVLSLGLADVAGLVVGHCRTHIGVLNAESAAEPAALLGHRQVDQGHAFDVTQQLVGTITKVQQPLAVAGRVIRHPMREICADVSDPENVDEELG